MDLREKILTAQDQERIAVQAWGETVYVRGLSSTELDEYQMEAANVERMASERNGHGVGLRNHRARLVALTAVDADGKAIFFSGDEILLGRRSAKEVNKLYEVACRLSGLSEEERKDAAKNSESGAESGSSSVSPSPSAAPLQS